MDFVKDLLTAEVPADARAIAGNFRMEERLPPEILAGYNHGFGAAPLSSLDDWHGLHKDFLDEYVNLIEDDEHPWTFRGDNRANLKAQDPITILRIESLETAIGLSGARLSVTEIEGRVRDLRTGSKDQKRAAERVLGRFVEGWNRNRDRRPQFATNQASTADILPDDPWSATD